MAVPPVFNASVGDPVTVTSSLKVTVTVIDVPGRIRAVAFVEVTELTVGAWCRRRCLLTADRVGAADGGRVNVALLVAASLMVPPENASELVAE